MLLLELTMILCDPKQSFSPGVPGRSAVGKSALPLAAWHTATSLCAFAFEIPDVSVLRPSLYTGKLEHVGGRGGRIYHCVSSVPALSLLAQTLTEPVVASASRPKDSPWLSEMVCVLQSYGQGGEFCLGCKNAF